MVRERCEGNPGFHETRIGVDEITRDGEYPALVWRAVAQDACGDAVHLAASTNEHSTDMVSSFCGDGFR